MNDMSDDSFLRYVRKRSRRAPGAQTLRGAKGGKGGGGAKIATDTLETKQVVRLIEAVCEGPIKSMSLPYFNETPLKDDQGNDNFSGVKVWTRLGTPGQTSIPGFSAQETPISVDAKVVVDTPVTRTITNPLTDAVKVQVKIPALAKTNTKNGNVERTDLSYRVRYKPAGAPSFIDIEGSPFTLDDEKSASPVHLIHKFALTGNAPWDVQVVRVTPDSTVETLQNDLYFHGYAEVLEQKLTYRNTAVLGIEALAEQFGSSLPSRAVLVEGLICKVPANFDPLTGTYSGVWNGTWKDAWTDDPCWCVREMVRNPRFGLGQFLPVSFLDDTSLYAISQYCNQKVDRGDGVMEPRFSFNAVLNSRMEAFDMLNNMVSMFRGMIYFASGAVRFVADMPRDPEITVTRANTVSGEFTYRGASLRTRHNRINVSYCEPDKFYKRDVVSVEDPEDIAQFGLRPKDIMAIGCTSRSQARRAGRWLLYTERMESEILSYVAGPDHSDIAPGAVVRVFDPSQMGTSMGGRLRAWNGTAITLDREVTLNGGTSYELVVHDANRVLHYRPVTSPAGTLSVVEVASPMPADMPPNPAEVVWGIRKTTGPDTLWRVMSNREVGKGQYEITAVRHEPSKYALVEGTEDIPPFPEPLLPTGPLAVPTNLRVVEYTTANPGAADSPSALATFTRPTDPRIRGMELAWQRKTDPWQSADLRMETRHILSTISATDRYLFRVRSYDGLGRFSRWSPVVPFRPGGRPVNYIIPNIQGVVITPAWRAIVMRWTNPDIPNFKEVEIWGGATNVFAQAQKLTTTSTERHTLGGLTNGETVHLWSRVRVHAATPTYSDFVYLGSATTTRVTGPDLEPGSITLPSLDTSLVDWINENGGTASGDAAAAEAYANLALSHANNAAAARALAEQAVLDAQAAVDAGEAVFADAQGIIDDAVAQSQAARDAAAGARDAALGAAQQAAGSAGAAAGSASSASSSASGASQSATIAQGHATTAQTAAGQASTSESNAATSATNAAGSASSAVTASEVAASSVRSAVQLVGNPDFSLDGTGWRAAWDATADSLPTGMSIVATGGYTGRKQLRTGTSGAELHAAGRVIGVEQARTYRLRVRVKNTGTAAASVRAFLTEIVAAGTRLGSAPDYVIPYFNVPTGGAWVEREAIYTAGAGAGNMDPTVVGVIAGLQGATTAGSNIHWDGVWFEDITDVTLTSQAATAAAASASSAAASEGLAGQHAGAASSSATTATTKAGEASTSATQAATSASTANTRSGEAANSAAAASASEVRARTTAALTLPSVMGDAWVGSNGGDPDTALNAHGNLGKTLAAGVLTIPANISAETFVLTRAALRWVQSRKYRISVEIRASAVVPNLVRGRVSGLDANYSYVSGAAVNTIGLSPTVANEWQLRTVTMTLGAPGAGVEFVRLGVMLDNTQADAVVEIRRIQIDDITIADEAAGSATAAAGSASNAQTSATNSQQSASAALGSQTAAETAASNAGTSATQASTAKTGAETAAAAASASETRAKLALVSTLPGDIADGSDFTTSAPGAPSTTIPLPATGNPQYTIASGVLTFNNVTTSSVGIRTRGTLPFINGHTYRVTARVRMRGGRTAGRLTAQLILLDSAYAQVTSATFGDFRTAATDTWETISVDWVAGAQSADFIRFGLAHFGTVTPAHFTDVSFIKVEDVTTQVESAKSASAASGHKDTAAASATAAGLSASAASVSETNAGISETRAKTSETNASTAATGASNSAAAASTSERKALSTAALTLPSDMGPFWVPTANANPETALSTVDSFPEITMANGIVTVPANPSANRLFLTRAAFAFLPDRKMRITAEVKIAALSANYVRALWYPLTAASGGTAGASQTRVGLSPTAAGVWQKMVLEVDTGTPPSGYAFMRMGLYLNSAETTKPQVEIRSILIEDITVAKEAQGYAQASFDEYDRSRVEADRSKQQADAASGFKTQAATSATNAGVSEQNAASAAQTAEGHSAQAFRASEVAARTMSGGVSPNPVFNTWATTAGAAPDSYTVTGVGTNTNASFAKHTGVSAKYTNAVYLRSGTGRTTDGPYLNLTSDVPSVPNNPEFIFATLEIERPVGNLAGCVLQAVWLNSSGASIGSQTLLLQGELPGAGTIGTVQTFFERPASAAAAVGFRLQLVVSSTAGGATRVDNAVRVHRMDFQIVTANASIRQWERAKVSVEGIISASYGMRVKAGSATGELELVALDNPVTGPTTAFRVNATNILLNGTVTGDLMSLNSIIIRDSAQIGGYAVNKIQKKRFMQGPHQGLWKLTANYGETDWTGGWTTVGTIAFRRRAGFQTELNVFFNHAAAGSWNSGKPNMSIAQIKWQRKRSDGSTWTDLVMMTAQSGEWGVQVNNYLNFTDTQTAQDPVNMWTQYRLVVRKANIPRHQNMSPYLDDFRVTMTHFKQGD